jgi:hypothetical protein
LDFNDPFDCRIPLIFKGGTDVQWEQRFKVIYEVAGGLDAEEAQSRAKKAVAIGLHRDMDDPGRSLTHLLKILRAIGVCCFTGTRESLLMWSHYSDSHRGFCLGFSATNDWFGGAQPVEYSECYPTPRFVEDSGHEMRRQMLLTKGKDWAYEEEWRIIRCEGGPGLYSYPRAALVEVVFGMRMREEDKRAIRDALATGGRSPSLIQARPQERGFALAFADIPSVI